MGGPARRVGCPVAVRGGRGARPARETDVRRNEMITSGPVVYTLTPRTTPPAGTRTARRDLCCRVTATWPTQLVTRLPGCGMNDDNVAMAIDSARRAAPGAVRYTIGHTGALTLSKSHDA